MSPLTAVTLLVTLNSTLPPATTSIVPVNPVVISAPAVSSTSPLAKTLMLPLPLFTSSSAKMFPASVCNSTFPAPPALTLTLSSLAVPSCNTRFPPATTITMLPPAALTTSLCVSVTTGNVVVLPLTPTRLMLTATSSTINPLVSRR